MPISRREFLRRGVQAAEAAVVLPVVLSLPGCANKESDVRMTLEANDVMKVTVLEGGVTVSFPNTNGAILEGKGPTELPPKAEVLVREAEATIIVLSKDSEVKNVTGPKTTMNKAGPTRIQSGAQITVGEKMNANLPQSAITLPRGTTPEPVKVSAGYTLEITNGATPMSITIIGQNGSTIVNTKSEEIKAVKQKVEDINKVHKGVLKKEGAELSCLADGTVKLTGTKNKETERALEQDVYVVNGIISYIPKEDRALPDAKPKPLTLKPDEEGYPTRGVLFLRQTGLGRLP